MGTKIYLAASSSKLQTIAVNGNLFLLLSNNLTSQAYWANLFMSWGWKPALLPPYFLAISASLTLSNELPSSMILSIKWSIKRQALGAEEDMEWEDV